MPDRTLHVLLIEDSPTDALLAQEALADAATPFVVTVVERLSEGLGRLAEAHVDAVLLDLGLPDSQGLETFAKVHGQAPGVPCVVLTNLAEERLAVMTVRAGAQDYLIKGQVGSDVLSRAIRYAVERAQAEEALAAKNDELRAMTQQLWQVAKLSTLGELAASIAHELNNPLTTITMWVESLLDKTPVEDAGRRGLEIVDQEAERMARLVENLLQFSRRSAPQISSLNLCQEIENTLELIQFYLRNHGVEVVRQFAADLPLVQADRQQVRQLLLNLLTNACDAMPQGGTLTVRAQPAAAGVTIEIADTGVGIVPEDLLKVMEPFFTTKPEGKGTGLGLAISRRVVQEHGGTIELQSELGQGTTVRIVFPRSHNDKNASHL